MMSVGVAVRLEHAVDAGAAGVDDPLGDALVVEVHDLLAEVEVLEQRRTALARPSASRRCARAARPVRVVRKSLSCAGTFETRGARIGCDDRSPVSRPIGALLLAPAARRPGSRAAPSASHASSSSSTRTSSSPLVSVAPVRGLGHPPIPDGAMCKRERSSDGGPVARGATGASRQLRISSRRPSQRRRPSRRHRSPHRRLRGRVPSSPASARRRRPESRPSPFRAVC